MSILHHGIKPRRFGEGLVEPDDSDLEAEAAASDPFAGTPPSAWPDWTDDRISTTGGDRMTLAELVGLWSERFASLDTGPAGLVAEVLEALAVDINGLGASTPDQYRRLRQARIAYRRHSGRSWS